jgi:hypothetical protein
MTPILEQERNKIFSEARTWNKSDEKKATREIYKYINRLPREERQLLFDRTGLKDKSGGVIKTATVNAGIFFASEWPIFAIGAAGGAVDPVGRIGLENKYVLAVILAGSYYPYVKGLIRAGREDYELLEDRGISSTALSKGLYETASRITESDRGQKIAAHTGFGLWYALLEFPYIAEAAVAVMATDKISSGISTATTVTLVGGAIASIQADVTMIGRDQGFNLLSTARRVTELKWERNKARYDRMKARLGGSR